MFFTWFLFLGSVTCVTRSRFSMCKGYSLGTSGSWGHLASQVIPEQRGFAQSRRVLGIIQHLVLQNYH